MNMAFCQDSKDEFKVEFFREFDGNWPLPAVGLKMLKIFRDFGVTFDAIFSYFS